MPESEPTQPELPLPFPDLANDLPLLPARMVNEYQYCPRLAYLEWVQGEWAESADTVEGRHAHRRADNPGGGLPPADEVEEDTRIHARSITLSSNRLGLIAKMDLIEGDGGAVVPVDYKRGKRPHVAKGRKGATYTPSMRRLSAAFRCGLIDALREIVREYIPELRLPPASPVNLRTGMSTIHSAATSTLASL